MAKGFIEKILDQSTPTFELCASPTIEGRRFEEFRVLLPQERQEEWLALAKLLENALRERGLRERMALLTPFEHALLNDAASGYAPIQKDGKIDYSLEHVPLSIIQNERFSASPMPGKICMSCAETAIGREYVVVGTADARYFHVVGAPNSRVSFALSTLGEDGKALWMPMAVAREKLADALKRLPIEQAFLECRLEGAALDELMVKEHVEERLNVVHAG
ncbi:MAG: hypothetical protein QW568_02625 [Candidatus Anstonellaceae archaeon]